ncbi:MAG: endolytic transglycosylase MltG [Clostridium sp.]
MNKNKMKIILGTVVIVATIAMGGIGFTYYNTSKHPLSSKGEEKINITVNEGEGFYSLVNRLKKEGIIKNVQFIKLNVKLNDLDVNIIPGTYSVNSDTSLKELLETLKKEDFSKNQIKITIPEGYTIEQMGDVFEEKGLFTKEEWLNAVKSYTVPSFIKNADKTRYALEGYLQAETYMFKNNATPDYVIEKMLEQFKNTLKEVEKQTGITIKDDDITRVITIASLIEEESKIDEDRRMISSVIQNRIAQNMKLQIDATVIYAHGKHLERVLYKHLELDSPYNTYFINGMPIGPIASPGIKSIIAAITPETSDYLYYLLSPDKKSHSFSKTLEEHNRKKIEFGY